MPLAREIAWGLAGAWRLLQGDARAPSRFNLSLAGFRRSFLAALLALPPAMLLDRLDSLAGPDAAGGVGIVGVELLAYALSWIAMPILAIPLCRVLGLGGGYIGYVVALNWSSAIMSFVALPVFAAIHLWLGWTLPGLALFLGFTAFLAYYRWFVARIALGASWTVATLFVVVEFTAQAAIGWLAQAAI